MTDFARFLNLYQSIGIETEIYTDEDGGSTIILIVNDKFIVEDKISILEIDFDKDGNFLLQTISQFI